MKKKVLRKISRNHSYSSKRKNSFKNFILGVVVAVVLLIVAIYVLNYLTKGSVVKNIGIGFEKLEGVLGTGGVFGGGDGSSAETPYIIQDCADLQAMQNDLDAYYVLGGNIDCSETRGWNPGSQGGCSGVIDCSNLAEIECNSAVYNSYCAGSNGPFSCMDFTTEGICPADYLHCAWDGACKGVRCSAYNNENDCFQSTDGCKWNSELGFCDNLFNDIFKCDTAGPYYGECSNAQNSNDCNSLSDCAWTDVIYPGFNPIGTESNPFTGNFNGRGYTISGLYVNREQANLGLFGYVNNAQISIVGLIDVDVLGIDSIGGLVGYNNGAISNSYSTGSISALSSYAGGLVGVNLGTILNSYSIASVSGISIIGGLVGGQQNGEVSNSYSIGSISGREGEFDTGGGLIGDNSGGTVTNSFFSGFDNGIGTLETGGASAFYSSSHDVYDSGTPIWDSAVWEFSGTGLPRLKELSNCEPQCSNKQCGDDGCRGSCGSCSIEQICYEGMCISPEFNAALSIATLKDSYSINEQIKITDPPDKINDKSSIINNEFNENLIKDRSLVDVNRINENYEEIKKNYKGYIIEFEDKPLVVKDKELKDIAKANEKKIKSMSKINPARYGYKLFSILEKDTKKKLDNYKNQITNKKQKIKNDIKNKLGKKKIVITGNAVAPTKASNPTPTPTVTNTATSTQTVAGSPTPSPTAKNTEDLNVIAEWDSVFNGIALDISDEEAEEIKSIHGVKSVSPNYEVRATLMDSVPLIQNGILAGNLDEDGNNCVQSGKECLTGRGIRIGIIDTGVDYTHPDLGGCTSTDFLAGSCAKVIGGYDFVNNDNDPMDDYGHGTHVAGIAAGNGNGGLKGVAPDAKLYVYKVLNSAGSGYSNDIISAIQRAIDPNQDSNFIDHLDVISLSLGGAGNPDDPVSTSVDNSVDAGIIAVISAGNSGPNPGTIGSPGCARKAITIGATYKKDYSGTYWQDIDPRIDQITSFSSRGPVEWTDLQGNTQSLTKPDIVAPGAIICSAQYDSVWSSSKCLYDKHVQISGTSMATPMVAGNIALLKQKNPNYNFDEIKTLIGDTSKDLGLDINIQGMGRIDLAKAMKGFDQHNLRILSINVDNTRTNLRVYIKNIGLSNENNVKLDFFINNVLIETRNIDNIISKEIKSISFDLAIVSKCDPYDFKVSIEPITGEEDISDNTKNIVFTYDIQIADGSGKEWDEPDIYNNKIVYHDATLSSNFDIYMYDLSTNTEKRITTWKTEKRASFNPHIYGDRIVYSSGFYVYMYDLATDTEKRITITGEGKQGSSDIYGNKVVYFDDRNGCYDIYMYDLATDTEKRITTDATCEYYPVIYGDKIVYGKRVITPDYADYYVYVYDLLTNTEKMIMKIVHFGGYISYDIYGDKIVYEDNRDGNWDIYMYDLATNIEKRITTNPSNSYSPMIYGDKIVYEDNRDGNWDIYMYDLATNIEKRITTNTYHQRKPVIYEDKIVYRDNYRIYMCYDLKQLPQSKLINNGNSVLNGRLTIILQKKDVNNQWQDVKVIINKIISIPAQGLLKLDIGKDNLGNQVYPGFNNLNVIADSAGDYRIYAKLEGWNGQFVESSWEFEVI